MSHAITILRIRFWIIIFIISGEKISMDILEQSMQEQCWNAFLQYKIERQHLSAKEEKQLREFLEKKTYIEWGRRLMDETYVLPLPVRREINKGGSAKKRVVYSYPYELNQMLKFVAYALYRYDAIFADNCYAFRREYGVKDAIWRIRRTKGIADKYCLKVDVHNYFNSIDEDILLEKLSFLQEQDGRLYGVLKQLLTADAALVIDEQGKNHKDRLNESEPLERAAIQEKEDNEPVECAVIREEEDNDHCRKEEMESGKVIREKRGAMAGTPVSPFFANVYLKDVDAWFADEGILYFRYSDDILIFADTLGELQSYQEVLYSKLSDLRLELNPDKVKISRPGEMWEFLGFCYRDGKVDLSENTIRKMQHKIKRKAESLRRWRRKKEVSGDKAAKGFIKAMNYKFFAKEDGTEFTWSRWFFPNLTTDQGLKIVDAYMQQYIRYCVTGRHYKGNYRITYEQMKEWGYRSLVAEYYSYKKQRMMHPDGSVTEQNVSNK